MSTDPQGEGTIISVSGVPITDMTKEQLADAVRALRVKRGITSQTRRTASGGSGPRAKKPVDLSDAEEL